MFGYDGEESNEDKKRNGKYKVYVKVLAEFSEDGNMRPLALMLRDGREYRIDRIRDCRKAASLKAGGIGIRYICEVKGRSMSLFYEENYKWFVVPR